MRYCSKSVLLNNLELPVVIKDISNLFQEFRYLRNCNLTAEIYINPEQIQDSVSKRSPKN